MIHRLPEDHEGTSWCARLRGLGTPEPVGFVLQGEHRIYRLLVGCVYEIVQRGERCFACVAERKVVMLTEHEAWTWLQSSRQSA